MKKSKELIPMIIAASDREAAIKVLSTTLEALNLRSELSTLNELKNSLDEFKKEFADLNSNYLELAEPRSYSDLHEIRLELNTLYRRVSDELSFEVNKRKVYYEEVKTAVRAEAIFEQAINPDTQAIFKTKSTSALRDIYGKSKIMQDYIVENAVSYGLWQELSALLQGIKMLIDSAASEEKHALYIEQNPL
jgi:N12 class adenine-specific DNA methylase